jgi:uncharacterized protein (TIGR02466 family)
VTQRTLLFPSPLHLSRPAGTVALRAELRHRLVEEAGATAGIAKSNVGGWHSPADLFTRPDPCFRQLATLMRDGLRAALAAECRARGKTLDPGLQIGGMAWAMVMGRGDYSQPHHHGDAHWAGVFYIDAGDTPPDAPPHAGHLTLLDPRGATRAGDPTGLFDSRQDLRPADGLLVFFPGWLVHHVHPYAGTRPRVSVAANLVLGAG